MYYGIYIMYRLFVMLNVLYSVLYSVLIYNKAIELSINLIFINIT